MHGRYAVFVKSKTPSIKVMLLSRRADVKPDLFWVPIPVPEAVRWHQDQREPRALFS